MEILQFSPLHQLDNGKCNYLEKKRETNEALVSSSTSARTKWVFIPPASMTRRKPDDEILETILVDAEFIINSRPLTYIHLKSAQHFQFGNSRDLKILLFEPILQQGDLRSNWKLAHRFATSVGVGGLRSTHRSSLAAQNGLRERGA